MLQSFEARILGAVMIGAPGEVYYSRAQKANAGQNGQPDAA
jgi:hypothetical protein